MSITGHKGHFTRRLMALAADATAVVACRPPPQESDPVATRMMKSYESAETKKDQLLAMLEEAELDAKEEKDWLLFVAETEAVLQKWDEAFEPYTTAWRTIIRPTIHGSPKVSAAAAHPLGRGSRPRSSRQSCRTRPNRRNGGRGSWL